MPSQGGSWFGRPVLAGHRDGVWRPIRFQLQGLVSAQARPGSGGVVEFDAVDEEYGLALHTVLEMTPQGLVRMRHELTNTAQTSYTLAQLACVLPLQAQAAEILDFAGRWARERSPQRAPFGQGVWSRENRRGRTGFDAGPLIAGTPGFGFRHGRVWALHTAWSGNHVQYAERLAEGTAVLGGGELLEAGEVRLGAGGTYRTPWVWFAFSDSGLDGVSRAFHGHLRARERHPSSPRPVTLNIWEAVYFDHSPAKLLELAERAAAVGVERFVVDDGWFRHRRGDSAGLGDWYVDEGVWPEGLHPLARRVREHGMQFGLWFEPEMANADSDLVRAHPDGLLVDPGPGRRPADQRNQQVLDLARPEVFDYLLERMSSLVGEYDIDYIKWDHNRDLAEPVHDGSAGTHAQTLAVYRLLDTLRARHPGLEIESCSSGGARVDLGILERTDRIWGSDNIDPFERQSIQRWTGLLVSAELIGSHVGSSRRPSAAGPPTSGSAARRRCSGTRASKPTSPGGPMPSVTAWPSGSRCTKSSGLCCTPARWCASPTRIRPHGSTASWYRIGLRRCSRGLRVSGRFLQEVGVAAPALANQPGKAFVMTLRQD